MLAEATGDATEVERVGSCGSSVDESDKLELIVAHVVSTTRSTVRVMVYVEMDVTWPSSCAVAPVARKEAAARAEVVRVWRRIDEACRGSASAGMWRVAAEGFWMVCAAPTDWVRVR